VLDGEPYEEAINEELDVPNKSLHWCSLNSVQIDLPILTNIVDPKISDNGANDVLNQQTDHDEV
jgi:hypothetical protein